MKLVGVFIFWCWLVGLTSIFLFIFTIWAKLQAKNIIVYTYCAYTNVFVRTWIRVSTWVGYVLKKKKLSTFYLNNASKKLFTCSKYTYAYIQAIWYQPFSSHSRLLLHNFLMYFILNCVEINGKTADTKTAAESFTMIYFPGWR